MNESINLTKILKNCPKGWEFYSSIYGWVYFEGLNTGDKYPVIISYKNGKLESFVADGRLFLDYAGECVLFPSKDQRDWSKFTAPWYKNEKKEKFDLSTLKPFSHVLVRDDYLQDWEGEIFTRYDEGSSFSCIGLCSSFAQCIPYNDDTKHLLGTDDEAPEYYRYWED